MKILFLAEANLMAPRGVSYATLQLVESLTKMGHQVDVICREHSGHSLPNPTKQPTWAKLPSHRDLASWASLMRRCLCYPARRHIDILHSVDATLCVAALCSQWLGIPFVHAMFSSHSDPASECLSALRATATYYEQWGIRRCSGTVVPSRSLEDLVSRYSPNIPIVRAEWKYVHVNSPDTIKRMPETTVHRAHPSSHPVFLYLGDLRRDHQILLDAFAHYRCLPNSPGHLVVIGGSPADIRRALSRAAQLGLEQRIHFLGAVEPAQVTTELAHADILLAPAILGHHPPLKLYAYLSARKPILATNIAAHTQVLEPATTCFVTPTAIDLARGMQLMSAQFRSQQTVPLRQETFAHDYAAEREIENAKLSLFYDDIGERCLRRDKATT